ncbi:MAG: oligosaccharide repeat unit polymerase [Prevotellaceae bacterium]|nr:oligosaccharide repeat unit polymerase [Prevotellaceae bacterium]
MDQKEFFYVILYVIGMFCLPLAYWLTKRKLWSISFIILFWYAFCAFTSIGFFYFFNPILETLSIDALKYFFCGMVIVASPLFIFDESKIYKIEIKPYYGIIRKLAVFLGVCSILPFAENFFFLAKTGFGDAVVDAHQAMNDGEGSHLSFLSLKLYNITSHFSDIAALLLCSLFFDFNANRKTIYWLLFTIIGISVGGFAGGGRATVVYQIMMMVIAYKIFSRFYTSKLRRKIRRIGTIVISAFIGITLIMTIARFGNKDITYTNETADVVLFSSSTVYTGESPIRFSSFGWNLKNNTDGHYLYDFIVRYIDDVHFKNNNENRSWAEMRTGLKYPQCFYGLPGFSYIDFGFVGGFVNLIFMVAIFLYYSKQLKGNIPLYKLFPMILCLKVSLMSLLFFPYCGSKILDILYVAALYYICKKYKTPIKQSFLVKNS